MFPGLLGLTDERRMPKENPIGFPHSLSSPPEAVARASVRCVSPPLEDVCLCVCITSLCVSVRRGWLVPVITFADLLQCNPGLLLQHQLMLCEKVCRNQGKVPGEVIVEPRPHASGATHPLFPPPLPLSPSCISDNHPLRDEEAEEAAAVPRALPPLPHLKSAGGRRGLGGQFLNTFARIVLPPSPPRPGPTHKVHLNA